MPHADPAARRQEILARTLEESNEPRFGYFGFTAPLAVGDNSMAPNTQRKVVEEGAEPIRNILTGPPKKGNTPDTLFSFETPLCVGDPYIEDAARNRRPKVIMVDPEASFKPPGAVRNSTSKGVEYVPECTGARDPKELYAKYKDYTPLRNFVTNPARKGGGGVLTPGVLFGFGEDLYFPPHVPDDYEAPRKLRTKEIEYHRSKCQEAPFRGMTYGNKIFEPDMESYHYEQPTHIPREPRPENIKIATHEAPFRPANPSKKGWNSALEPFPEHMPDPIPQPAVRKPKSDVEQPPAWRPGAPREVANPQPSVVMNVRNLRCENPKSFARPTL